MSGACYIRELGKLVNTKSLCRFLVENWGLALYTSAPCIRRNTVFPNNFQMLFVAFNNQSTNNLHNKNQKQTSNMRHQHMYKRLVPAVSLDIA